MPQRGRSLAAAGFTLLPVVLAMSLIGAIAFMLNRDNGLSSNLIGSRSDLERARYAAEAGLQAVNYTIQGLDCAGSYPISSSPVTDSNFGGAAYSAYADNTSGSPLTLRSTGTYNGASVILKKTNAYVYHSGVRPWFTQPGPGTGKDATVRSDPASKDKNYGGNYDLEIDKSGKETLIAFDLSPLPAGSRFVPSYQFGALRRGATISLFQSGGGRGDFLAMLITHDWVEGTGTGSTPTAGNPGVTWNRWNGLSPNTWPQGPGNGYDARTLIPVPEPQSNPLDIDVTAAAVGWMSGVNYGVWLQDPTDKAKGYDFYSSEYPFIPSLRPKLTAYYLLPCGASAP